MFYQSSIFNTFLFSVKKLFTTHGKGGFYGFFGDMNLMLLIHGTNSVNHMLKDYVEKLIPQNTSIKFVHHRNFCFVLFALMPCSLPDKQTTY